jgi:aminoglycoside/choline kinase family phosphotransferase
MIPSDIERDKKLKLFINSYFDQAKYFITPMQSDAGMRSYYRVHAGDKTYIVMDCPPDYAKVSVFAKMSRALIERGFSAPKILKQDDRQGFLILEDFGRISLKNYLKNHEQDLKKKHEIYCLIVDLLVALQDEHFTGLKEFDNNRLSNEISPFADWYIPYAYKKKLTESQFEDFKSLWLNVLKCQAPMPKGIVLRDFHLENMMYLENRISIKKIGLLDFQDALYGSPVYDLVSVLEDARFNVPRPDALKMIDYFAKAKSLDKEELLLNYHILGAQRNCRILGVFAKKSLKDRDDAYLKYIPRVCKYLDYDLSHPIMKDIKQWLNDFN